MTNFRPIVFVYVAEAQDMYQQKTYANPWQVIKQNELIRHLQKCHIIWRMAPSVSLCVGHDEQFNFQHINTHLKKSIVLIKIPVSSCLLVML